MTHSEDLDRMAMSTDDNHGHVMLAWVMICGILVFGFSALFYAVGKWVGMHVVCR